MTSREDGGRHCLVGLSPDFEVNAAGFAVSLASWSRVRPAASTAPFLRLHPHIPCLVSSGAVRTPSRRPRAPTMRAPTGRWRAPASPLHLAARVLQRFGPGRGRGRGHRCDEDARTTSASASAQAPMRPPPWYGGLRHRALLLGWLRRGLVERGSGSRAEWCQLQPRRRPAIGPLLPFGLPRCGQAPALATCSLLGFFFRPLGLRHNGLPRGELWLRGAMQGWWEVGGYAIGRGGHAPLSPCPSRRFLRDGDPGDAAPSPSVPPSPPGGGRTRLLAIERYDDSTIPRRESRLAPPGSPGHDSAFFLSIQRSYGAPRECATHRLTDTQTSQNLN